MKLGVPDCGSPCAPVEVAGVLVATLVTVMCVAVSAVLVYAFNSDWVWGLKRLFVQ